MRWRSGALYGIAALVSVLATTAWLLPASWFAPAAALASGGRVLLQDVEGSVWNGSMTIVLCAADGSATPTAVPGRVHFATRFAPLLQGHLQIELKDPEAIDNSVTIDASRAVTTIGAASMRLPASALAGLGAPFNTLALSGRLTLTTTVVQGRAGALHGAAVLVMRDMSSKLSPIHPLGSWRVAFDANAEPAAITVSTLQGPLNVTGQGTLAGGVLRFRGHASAASDASGNLADLLSILGPPDGDGVLLTFGN